MINIDIKDTICSYIQNGSLIVGIGSRLRSDDAVGSIVAERLAQSGCNAIDVSNSPENYAGKIAKILMGENEPRLLILDALHFDGEGGEINVFDVDDLTRPLFMTHGPTNIPYLIDYLRSCKVEANVKIIGIQPVKLDFGLDMSPEIEKSMDELTEFILSCMKQQ